MDKLELFPYILARFGGGSFEIMKLLQIKHSREYLDNILQLKRTMYSRKEELCDELYKIISESGDSKIQNILLNFKRDLFNGRSTSGTHFESAKVFLKPEFVNEISQYNLKNEEYSRAKIEFNKEYLKDLVKIREHFRELVINETLQKGLILSSQSLLKRSKSYTLKNCSDLKKDDIRIEQSLIKYISRIYAKTSPFSTFTNLGVCKIHNLDGGMIDIGKEINIRSNVRINSLLFVFLMNLLFRNKQIYKHIPLRANPTLKKEEENYVFLVNNYNVESFQRMKVNEVLELLIFLINSVPGGMSLNKTVNEIIKNEYVEASSEELEDYIYSLIEYGFFEINIGVSAMDPEWDTKLCRQLSFYFKDNADVICLVEVLEDLRKFCSDYEVASVTSRNEILTKAHFHFKQLCYRLHEAAGLPAEERTENTEVGKNETKEVKNILSEVETKPGEEFKHERKTKFFFSPEQMFYEDTSVKEKFKINASSLEPIVESLQLFISEIEAFETHIIEKIKMKNYFISKYNKNDSVSLLMFYEDYYRDFKKPEMEKGVKTLKSDENKESSEATAENGPETIPEIEKYNQDSETFKANLHDIFKKMTNIKSDEVKIDVEMLRSAKKNNTSLNINVPKTSYGAFLQLYVNEDPSGNKNNIGIVNYITAGYGKMVSRFLHIFDRSVSDELCKFNEEMQNGRMFLENTDATVFNANMHYALMPYEIWMPGGQNTLEEEKQIPVTDISVMYSEADETLKLIHDKSGKEINMFDLGFIIPNNRSNLFRLLDNFTLSKNLYYGVIISSINDIYGYGPAGNKDARVIPRIVFNNNLILQRKSWVISKKNIPFKKSGEQISEYFVRINEWRDLLGISSEVFMVLLSKDKNINNPDPKNSRGVVRDDYKPQFIDFSNPLLVELFEKNIQKLTGDLILKEMLPGPDQLLNVMNKPLVSEFVIQWYEK